MYFYHQDLQAFLIPQIPTPAIENTDTEDGELPSQSDPDIVSYDMDKIVEYPGFNAPVPRGVRDVCTFF